VDLTHIRMSIGSKLADGDRTRAFWAGLFEVFPATQEQCYGVYKTASLLNRLPRQSSLTSSLVNHQKH
jgi:hypothetical protein